LTQGKRKIIAVANHCTRHPHSEGREEKKKEAKKAEKLVPRQPMFSVFSCWCLPSHFFAPIIPSPPSLQNAFLRLLVNFAEISHRRLRCNPAFALLLDLGKCKQRTNKQHASAESVTLQSKCSHGSTNVLQPRFAAACTPNEGRNCLAAGQRFAARTPIFMNFDV